MSNEMKEIDWSKAPEGATHFDTRGNCCSIGFMKPGVRRGEWEYFGMDGHWILYGPVDSALEAAMIKRPADTSWTGEGLPPAGTVCQLRTVRDPDAVFDGWGKAEIMYSSKDALVWRWQGHTSEFGAEWPDVEFRPIRTPEQIAAEERRAAILEMKGHLSFSDYREAEQHCAALYDAGYRKVTP